MTTTAVDLMAPYEDCEWQKPLFEALTRRGVSFAPFDLTRAAFDNDEGIDEADELTAILTASHKTARRGSG